MPWLVRRNKRGLGAFLFGALVVGIIWRRARVSSPLAIPSGTLCDPFSEPGFLEQNETDPTATTWIPFRPSCAPAPDYLHLLATRDVSALSFLANRTILVLGDSVDRNGLEHLATMLDLPRAPSAYKNIRTKGNVPKGWDERGVPWIVEMPWLGLTLTNGYIYGLDDADHFREQTEWHAPGMAEERVDRLFKVHADQLAFPPSFISLHSGLWDLALFAQQDLASNHSLDSPLSHERTAWWQTRMLHLVAHVRRTWPGVPVWLRSVHRVGPRAGGGDHDWRGTNDSAPTTTDSARPNFFADVRVHQLREMQKQVSRDAQIPIFDFGEIWEGWQDRQDGVYPSLDPAGPIYAQALMHHIWMEQQGREKWALERTLAPLRPAIGQEL